MGDLLLAVKSKKDCLKATQELWILLRTLAQLGYQVSKKKAQIRTSHVTYSGYELKERKRLLSKAHIDATESLLQLQRSKLGNSWETSDITASGYPGLIDCQTSIISYYGRQCPLGMG